MGGMRILVIAMAMLAGCLPRPQPAQPAQPAQPPVQQTAQAQPPPQQPPPQQPPPQQPLPQQPMQPTDPSQPQPVQNGAGYAPPPQGYYPQQGYPQQQYPQQQYPQQQYPQPYYPPAPAQPWPAPGTVVGGSEGHRRYHDGEVIADFAIVGTMGSIDFLARQDVQDGNVVTFAVLAGLAGGGGVGYLLTNKYEVDAGTAHATTLGMSLGFANGALMIEPTGWKRGESVLNFLFFGSAIGAGAGFAYGKNANLTSGQATFVANMTLLGTATAALGAISGSRDGQYGTWENTTLLVGVDGGTAAGMIIAPSLDWSPHRAKLVMASTVIGAFAGGMLGGLLTPTQQGESRSDNGDIVTAAMTAGLWGGFGLGIMMTKRDSPDPRFAQTASASPTTIAPWVGHQGTYGVMAGGSF
ncbi:MAG TPA: hypothetical protein VMZ53_11220 [Kofleriaceae bacterium]|nr:hypothetical protein [Kofleriaceae bacterium]